MNPILEQVKNRALRRFEWWDRIMCDSSRAFLESTAALAEMAAGIVKSGGVIFLYGDNRTRPICEHVADEVNRMKFSCVDVPYALNRFSPARPGSGDMAIAFVGDLTMAQIVEIPAPILDVGKARDRGCKALAVVGGKVANPDIISVWMPHGDDPDMVIEIGLFALHFMVERVAEAVKG